MPALSKDVKAEVQAFGLAVGDFANDVVRWREFAALRGAAIMAGRWSTATWRATTSPAPNCCKSTRSRTPSPRWTPNTRRHWRHSGG